jgi:tetratricopeptide (TPR) repeat protein
MKYCFCLCLALGCLFLPALAQNSDPTTNSNPSIATSPNAPALLDNLSPDDRRALGDAVNGALTAYNQENYDSALAQLDPADKISPKNPGLLNLRGAILMRQQKWDLAAAQFNAALGIDSKYFPAKFNLGEIPYMQKKYPEARAIYQKILDDNPKNELLMYKIFMTYLMENNLDQAQTWMSKFDAFGDSPAYYFSQAAWNYYKKQNEEAESYVASSANIYPPAANIIFAESLVEAGWLKRPKPPQP